MFDKFEREVFHCSSNRVKCFTTHQYFLVEIHSMYLYVCMCGFQRKNSLTLTLYNCFLAHKDLTCNGVVESVSTNYTKMKLFGDMKSDKGQVTCYMSSSAFFFFLSIKILWWLSISKVKLDLFFSKISVH